MISFSFDDVTASALNIGAKLLEQRGLRGSYYIAAGLIGQTGHMGEYATDAQVAAAARAGHDIGCHTYSHLDCGQASSASVGEDIDRNRQALARLGVSAPSTFAYPYGDVSASGKREAGRRFALSRALHHGIVQRGTDLNQAPAVGVEGDDGEEIALRWMQRAHAERGWLILFTHGLETKPNEFSASIDGFTRLIDGAIASGFDIVTVAEGAKRLGA
jgi:peptidoglycan/xylan/chitin deacetylase (PgdA/CDA1 family)